MIILVWRLHIVFASLAGGGFDAEICRQQKGDPSLKFVFLIGNAAVGKMTVGQKT